jgi:2'-5' RNA ligase
VPMPSQRLFWALWPQDNVRQQLQSIQQNALFKGFKVVRPDNLHLTLVFLGQVNDEQRAFIIDNANRVRVPEFSVILERLSYWRKPGIICLTPQSHESVHQQLVEQLNRGADDCGIVTEKRPYRPHVTLARYAKHAIRLEPPPLYWHVDSFVLCQSVSTHTGVRYRVLQQWGLTG